MRSNLGAGERVSGVQADAATGGGSVGSQGSEVGGEIVGNTIVVRAGEKYSINFSYKGTAIRAETAIPEKPMSILAVTTVADVLIGAT